MSNEERTAFTEKVETVLGYIALVLVVSWSISDVIITNPATFGSYMLTIGLGIVIALVIKWVQRTFTNKQPDSENDLANKGENHGS
jgi:uncharacterized membrane protein